MLRVATGIGNKMCKKRRRFEDSRNATIKKKCWPLMALPHCSDLIVQDEI